MQDNIKPTKAVRSPSLLDALIPLLSLIFLIALSVFLYGIDS